MKLFSEKVTPTLTNSSLNILQVENYDEIFFGVYEVEINKTKYPVEKISEHNGNPVVSVPVEVKGKKANYPFVLTKGKFDILFNENSDYVELFESKIEEVETEPAPIVEKIVEEKIQLAQLEDKRHLILEEIKNAKQKALEATEKEIRRKKQLQLRQIKEEAEKKEEALRSYLESARENLVDEFVGISNKIKLELVGSNDNRFSEISETIDNKIQDLANTLSESLKKDFNTSSKQFDSSIRQLVKELYEKQINPRVDKELENIAKEIVEKVDTIKSDLDTKLETKVEKTLVEGLEKEVDAIRDANIELNNSFNKGVNKALSRVGNVDKKVDELTIAVSEDIENKISTAEENIKDYYNQRLQMLEEKAFDINEETRKYFISLIQESKDNLISEIRKIKNEKPIEYIIEANGKKEVKDFDSIQKEFDKKISSKIDNEVTRLRKYIAVYSGGGSVAQQFAAGGTMNGDLTVVGSISASQYLGLSIPSGDYLPLSGGTITGDLGITGDITTVDSIQFDTVAGVTVGEGQLAWNSAESTLNIGVNNEVTLQVGQETLVQVKASETIRNGQVVFASGASGGGSGNITVSAYRANSTGPDEMYMLGVATQELTINEYGFITTFGKVRDVAVEFTRASDDPEYALPYNQGWEIGTVLYVSAVDRGRFTSVPPTAPDKKMPIVMVIAKNGNSRIFFVRAEHGYHLNELHDVRITNLSANDLLSYNAVSGVWTNTRNLVVDSLSANTINALSANITVIDIKQYELSGFNVQGNATVQGTISSTGPIYSNGNQVATVVDPVRTTLTGNGVLSTFAISGANTLVNPSALIVAIDGALQEPVVDYTVLSGSITFTSPLPNGSKAVVISPTNSLQVSQMIPADGSVTSAKLDANIQIAGQLTAPNQTASSNSSVMTRSSIDELLLDTSLIYFKDDFVSVTDGLNTMVGELGWTAFSPIGTGNIRPLRIYNGTFGVVGLQSPASFRGSTVMTWDTDNTIGGGGFSFQNNGLENQSTIVKFRFQLDNLTSSIGAGFGIYSAASYKQNRFFGLRYALPSSAWTSSTAITLNQYRRPTVANGRRYYASVAGTTGTTEPTWPTTAGGTVVDGTVTWTENGLDGNSNLVLHECNNSTDEYANSTIVDTGITAAANTWYNVVMTYVSGSTWNFTINGANAGNLTMSTANRGSTMLPVFKIEASAATAMYLSVDYFIFFSRGITR